MNGLYHWHAEEMVRHEMQEVDRALKQAHLLREAGLSRPGPLARVLDALRNVLSLRKNRLRDRQSGAAHAYPSAKEKLSQATERKLSSH